MGINTIKTIFSNINCPTFCTVWLEIYITRNIHQKLIGYILAIMDLRHPYTVGMKGQQKNGLVILLHYCFNALI